MTEDKLKLILTDIRINNYLINDDNMYYSYALEMLSHIGTTDSYLRDDLIYNVFSNWVIQNRFSNDEIDNLLKIALDKDHLMKCIGAQDNGTVFARSFSSLIIAVILYHHNHKKILSDNMILQTKNTLIEYYIKEMDLRGYINNKGWAHSVAHGADAIDELANCTSLKKEDLFNLLKALKTKICQGEYVYIDGEPDRMSIATRGIFMRDEINEGDMLLWLEDFKNYTYTKDSSIEWYHQSVNITNFLKSLYFTLKSCIRNKVVLDKIQDLITTLL